MLLSLRSCSTSCSTSRTARPRCFSACEFLQCFSACRFCSLSVSHAAPQRASLLFARCLLRVSWTLEKARQNTSKKHSHHLIIALNHHIIINGFLLPLTAVFGSGRASHIAGPAQSTLQWPRPQPRLLAVLLSLRRKTETRLRPCLLAVLLSLRLSRLPPLISGSSRASPSTSSSSSS